MDKLSAAQIDALLAELEDPGTDPEDLAPEVESLLAAQPEPADPAALSESLSDTFSDEEDSPAPPDNTSLPPVVVGAWEEWAAQGRREMQPPPAPPSLESLLAEFNQATTDYQDAQVQLEKWEERRLAAAQGEAQAAQAVTEAQSHYDQAILDDGAEPDAWIGLQNAQTAHRRAQNRLTALGKGRPELPSDAAVAAARLTILNRVIEIEVEAHPVPAEIVQHVNSIFQAIRLLRPNAFSWAEWLPLIIPELPNQSELVGKLLAKHGVAF